MRLYTYMVRKVDFEFWQKIAYVAFLIRIGVCSLACFLLVLKGQRDTSSGRWFNPANQISYYRFQTNGEIRTIILQYDMYHNNHHFLASVLIPGNLISVCSFVERILIHVPGTLSSLATIAASSLWRPAGTKCGKLEARDRQKWNPAQLPLKEILEARLIDKQ